MSQVGGGSPSVVVSAVLSSLSVLPPVLSVSAPESPVSVLESSVGRSVGTSTGGRLS